MTYQAIFNGWDELTLSDLLVAYRKAKTDLFFENSFPTAIKFAEYEQDLLENLTNLLTKLKENEGFLKNKALLGECRLAPKKLGLNPKGDDSSGHTHFSDPERAFKGLCERNELEPAFRVIGDFPVDTHIVSALWINMVGHKFDACLDDTAYGSRLRRIRSEDVIGAEYNKPFHITAIGSFEPYFQPYKRWRGDGLNAIRGELENDRHVVAISLDLRSYYHLLDPAAISTKYFQKEIGLTGENELSETERDFTTQISKFLKRWADRASAFAKDLTSDKADGVNGGLTIGLVASRIISNVILHKWDRLIREKITPIHYGRYVDDMFLVLRDPGTITDTESAMRFLQDRLGEESLYPVTAAGDKDSIWEIHLGERYQKKSSIQLQSTKQKLFVLEGQAGCDLLDSIEKEIYELSSEYRLMPSPDQLEHSTAARVLSAAGSVAESADNLRRADGLTVRRLSWSLQLRHVETLARDLPPKAWENERNEFYQFAYNHILRPDNLFAHYSYLPRLLGFAVSLNEWDHAEAIVSRAFSSLDQLAGVAGIDSEVEINGTKCHAGTRLWKYAYGGLAWSFIDAAAKYYDADSLLTDLPSKKVSKLAEIFMSQLWGAVDSVEDILKFEFGSEEFYSKAPLLAACDLARTPYKRILCSKSANSLIKQNNKSKERKVIKAFEATGLLDIDSLKEFLMSSKSRRLFLVEKGNCKFEGFRPYLFPTRPYTPTEVAELAPECVGIDVNTNVYPAALWAKYVRALRGVWVKPSLLSGLNENKAVEVEPKKPRRRYRLNIGTDSNKTVVVAITNILTTDGMWASSACGKPNLTLHRYKRITELVNQAIQLDPKPDYLIFPELSLPIQWIRSIGNRLTSSGISLIAGAEYRHYPKNEIVSEACLELIDDRLGFTSSVRIWQEKRMPSAGEEKELISKFGKSWKPTVKGKRLIYNHNDFHFGVMVCSELQNSKARVCYQGLVDGMMVLSWNQDLDTFASLVESAALDVHAYTILVNNRKYGDSRVRAPSKESFKRDLARLRGGENDFCVTVELDIEKLRAFQSRAKRWPEDSDPFKPVPEGYVISPRRKLHPPK